MRFELALCMSNRMHRPERFNRRRFLAQTTLAGIAATFPQHINARAADVSADEADIPPAPAPISAVDRFNYVAGTQTFDPAYHFTAKPRLQETAEGIREMGCSVIKLNVSWDKSRGPRPARFRSLTDLAAGDSVLRGILDMPFGQYQLWAYPLGRQDETAVRDEEVYELGCHLLRRYNRSGKQFYLGHWEGDWEIRGRAGSKEDPTPQAIEKKIAWLKRRQKAVDDAKAATPHTDVGLWCYAEANLARDAMAGRPTMVNAVIPEAQADFVSYSSWDTTNTRTADLPQVLDFIESKLPRKETIPGKRVWIGEYGFPAEHHSPEQQDARSREVVLAGLRWGCPFVLYWEFYNNEVVEGRQRGFWMVDDQGRKQPVYHTHRQFCAWAREFVSTAVARDRKAPGFDEYQKAAVAFLASLK